MLWKYLLIKFLHYLFELFFIIIFRDTLYVKSYELNQMLLRVHSKVR